MNRLIAVPAHEVTSLAHGVTHKDEMEPAPRQPVAVKHWITREELNSDINSWADADSRAVAAGFRVTVENIDWGQACQKHGFFGAIYMVKLARRIRIPVNAWPH
jgi:hypothetical protein